VNLRCTASSPRRKPATPGSHYDALGTPKSNLFEAERLVYVTDGEAAQEPKTHGGITEYAQEVR